jgi:hypothetical protein
MATTNRERATSAFDILTAGLRPFVVQQMRGQRGHGWWPEARQKYGPSVGAKPENLDALALLKIMRDNWKPVFAHALDPLVQGFVTELLEYRNRWAHQEEFSSADTVRLLDTTERMLTAVSASAQAAEIQKIGAELARTMYAEQARQQTRSRAAAPVYHHREEIDRAIAGDETFAAALRQSISSATERGSVAEAISNHSYERVPRAEEAAIAVEVFEDDDPGFLGWRDSHPHGYVVNAYRNPTPDYLMLHRTSCPHLHRPVAEGRWTRDFVKVCATRSDDLAAWARQAVTDSARLKPCHWCKP